MKYLYWFMILGFVVLRRIIFPLVYIAIPMRDYLRNTVYNYHLNNGIVLKRLWERKPEQSTDGKYWILDGGSHASTKGLVPRKDVPAIVYWLVLPMWLLLDDDCNEDTYDKGFNQTIIDGERKKWMPEFIKKELRKAVDLANMNQVRGNSFDLGDTRAGYPLYEFWSVFWWTLRNPAYNFNYKFNQMCDEKKAWNVQILGRVFGWIEEEVKVGTKKCYSWECGRKI